jgi:hypothetical protein
MSYLRYFCLFAYSGVQQLCCDFPCLVYPMLPKFLGIVHFQLPLLYSLTFIYYNLAGNFVTATIDKH